MWSGGLNQNLARFLIRYNIQCWSYHVLQVIMQFNVCRESLRISVTNLHEAITPTEEKDRFKKFQEAEKKRYRAEQQR